MSAHYDPATRNHAYYFFAHKEQAPSSILLHCTVEAAPINLRSLERLQRLLFPSPYMWKEFANADATCMPQAFTYM